MGTYNIPRNTKGENRILMIFSIKAFIYTIIAVVIGIPLFMLFRAIGVTVVGIVIEAIFGAIGFCIGTFKIQPLGSIKFTNDVAGENIDEVIKRAVKFKAKGHKIYVYTREDDKNV